MARLRRTVVGVLAMASVCLSVGHVDAQRLGPAIVPFGDARSPGDPAALRLNRPIVGMAATPSGEGYWLVASDGGVFAFGDALFHGSTGGLRLNRPIVGMAPSSAGYWLVASDGGVFAFGDALFHGSTGGLRLNRPIVGMAASSAGYWLVASDGGVFAFGDALFHGSTGGLRLNRPIVGMAPSSAGYWLVASDGGVFAFGDALFHGSTGGLRLNRPIVGMAASSAGYWLVASDGGVFAFGDAEFSGAPTPGTERAAAAIVPSPSGRGYLVLAVPASIRVGFGGDVHGVGRVGAFLAGGGNPLAPMAPVLAANDVNVVNLETAVGSAGAPAAKQYTFQSSPSLLTALRASGVHVVSLANNHSLDYGPAALLETIDHARAAGLAVVGAGADSAQAYAPAILGTPGGTVAVVGLSQVVQAGWAAGPGRPGVASAYDLAASLAAVRSARVQADHVVVVVHWGTENTDCPNGKQASLAAALLAGGADAVVGHHPHRLQGISTGDGRLVAYSLGNFVWYNNAPPNDLTGVLSVELDAGGVGGYDFTPARIDNNGRPVPLSGQAAADAVGHLASLTPGAGRC
jgi:hypothetical protein